MDTLVLTLACGKFRFNDLDLGGSTVSCASSISGNATMPTAPSKLHSLADAFGCTVNDLPLTLVLTWYEQSAVCILLTLLALGIKKYLSRSHDAGLSFQRPSSKPCGHL